MKKILKPAVAAIIVVCVSVSLHAQQVFKTTPTSVIPYLEYLPQDYAANSNKYPIVFFLHGIGERGPNSTDVAVLEAGVWTITKNGPPKLVKYGQQFPFILISIQLKNNYGSWPTSYVLEVINHVKSYLRVDERRIHITGLSMGGGGTWTMAQTYPELFATATPICGGYNAPSKACAIAGENLPVWAFHGDADTVVPYSKTVTMVNAINACVPTPNPAAKLTIYPGLNHNVWDRAYTPNNTYHTPNLYEWMLPTINRKTKSNTIPVVNAGSDKVVTGKTTSLAATVVDDGSIVSYAWAKISGGACTLTNANASTVSLSGLVPGKYMFRCTATDNAGATDTDYVQVTVNQAPVVNAGADISITLPTAAAKLTGTATDADGTIASYKWVFISGPVTPVLTNASTVSVSVAGMTAAGNYVFELQAKDNLGAIGKDQAVVKVAAAISSAPLTTSNVLPVANAGQDVVIYRPATTTKLTGSGMDPDGTISSYAWTQVSGPVAATLSGATTPTVSVSNLTVEGFYVFKLTVKDNAGATAFDKVAVTVKAMVTSSSMDAYELDEPQVADLARDEDPYWNGKEVRIYSQTGAQIYTGEWTASSYETVLAPGGFFIYNVLEGGKNIFSGKVAVR